MKKLEIVYHLLSTTQTNTWSSRLGTKLLHHVKNNFFARLFKSTWRSSVRCYSIFGDHVCNLSVTKLELALMTSYAVICFQVIGGYRRDFPCNLHLLNQVVKKFDQGFCFCLSACLVQGGILQITWKQEDKRINKKSCGCRSVFHKNFLVDGMDQIILWEG